MFALLNGAHHFGGRVPASVGVCVCERDQKGSCYSDRFDAGPPLACKGTL